MLNSTDAHYTHRNDLVTGTNNENYDSHKNNDSAVHLGLASTMERWTSIVFHLGMEAAIGKNGSDSDAGVAIAAHVRGEFWSRVLHVDGGSWRIQCMYDNVCTMHVLVGEGHVDAARGAVDALVGRALRHGSVVITGEDGHARALQFGWTDEQVRDAMRRTSD